MQDNIAKAYKPGLIEDKWYKFWEKQGYFTPKIEPEKKPFVVIMPPLNVTGEIHMGHALAITIEDIFVRWHRMKGEPTLWLPGTDHAGIATQIIIEKQLAEQGINKNELSREQFQEIAWKWTNNIRENISRQSKILGASCDWSRECFTLDEGPYKAVISSFVNLYKKGLIYRGERIINWCPRCQTALSDLEVEHKSTTGQLFYIHYHLAEGNGFVTIATTRPETLLGDTAIAVNPEDKRYKGKIGKDVILPIVNRRIPIIADEAVDPSFGSGALKITPAHDPVDFEIGKRHGLPIINIMNDDATINQSAINYAGLDRLVCRDKIVTDLKNNEQIEKIEPYLHSVGYCGRCGTMIEPRVSMQWFVRTKPLAESAIKVVKNGEIKITPRHFTKVYFDWMENIKDWCISRQLWWGHRIPVWYCSKCGQPTVSESEPANCQHCGMDELVQDPDVLDTWFSSALWPHSTLGWPDDTEDLRYFYPTSVMETGYDILFFWVARMIMMSLENTGVIPFHTVYLNGLIRDEHGEKMSKMRGNVIDPVDAINVIGVDALRFGLTSGTTSGNDISLGKDKLESSRNFVNKLWNASRFILQNLEKAMPDGYEQSDMEESTLSMAFEDRWINSRLNRLINNINELMVDFKIGEAEQQLHDFIWSEYCDWYIEFVKTRLRTEPIEMAALTNSALILEKLLRLLHPFMPFITEELWQKLKYYLHDGNELPASIMIASYPIANNKLIDEEAEQAVEAAIEVIQSIRNVRAEYKVIPSKFIEARLYAGDHKDNFTALSRVIAPLARVKPLAILSRTERKTDNAKSSVLVLKEAEIVLPWDNMLDIVAEKERLIKEITTIQALIDQLKRRLADQVFISKAPSQIVDKERAKLLNLNNKLERLLTESSQLG